LVRHWISFTLLCAQKIKNNLEDVKPKWVRPCKKKEQSGIHLIMKYLVDILSKMNGEKAQSTLFYRKTRQVGFKEKKFHEKMI